MALRGDQPGHLPTDAAWESQTTELPGLRARIYLCFLNSVGLGLAKGGIVAVIWVWGLVYCLFNVRNVNPLCLMRCNDCRSPRTAGGYLDYVNALNYVVNTFKQKLLMTTLAAGLFFEGSYLHPSALKCGPIF